MKIGLFFGSFNPVHIGHLIIANYICEVTDLDQVWFVVSPQNPFKKSSSLLNEYDRLSLVRLAIEGNEHLRASQVEFSLPKPSYTIDTLTHLGDEFPAYSFSLIMGSDNLATLKKWKNYELILDRHAIYVYRRAGYEGSELDKHQRISLLNVPLLNVSATFIRNSIKQGISMKYFLPEKVFQYIEEMNLYK